MKLINVIIVDDEANARLLLRSMLSDYIPDVHVLDEAANIPEAIKKIHIHKPHLVFLDIEMPGYTGLEILDFFDKERIEFDIVFVTAYSEFAVNAFDLNASDYLLKPIKKEKLERAVERVRQKLEAKSVSPISIDKSSLDDKIALQSSEGLTLIYPSDVLYLKADGAYTQFILRGGKRITVAKTLNDFMKLEDKGYFVRVHRSYIINVNHIKKVLKMDKGTVLMEDDMEVSVSQDKKEQLYKIIEGFKI